MQYVSILYEYRPWQLEKSFMLKVVMLINIVNSFQLKKA